MANTTLAKFASSPANIILLRAAHKSTGMRTKETKLTHLFEEKREVWVKELLIPYVPVEESSEEIATVLLQLFQACIPCLNFRD